MNSINLTGNLCTDIELKQTNGGKSVAQFNIAVKRPFAKDTTDFIPVVAWEQTAEFLSRYASKGTKIAVSGKLTSRNYEDKNGNKRTAYEVIADAAEICEAAAKNGTQGDGSVNHSNYMPDAYKTPRTANFEPLAGDETLPF